MKAIRILMMAGLGSGMGLMAETVNFDALPTGQTPPGWKAACTGGGASKWTVEAEAGAPSGKQVLKQSAVGKYPLCLQQEPRLKDGYVEVKFKTVSGKEDQAAGVIWRALDKDNYYICRANALEDNVVLYKLEGGKRQALDIVGRKGGYGVKEKVTPGQWQTLRVDFAGNRFKALLNGKPLFEVEDTTFAQAGMVGLWTKADSVTLFDDFSFGSAK